MVAPHQSSICYNHGVLKVKQVVYLTGSNGFIGSQLAKRLISHTPIFHQDIQKTDFSNAGKVFFCSSYGNMTDQKDDTKTLRANITDLIYVLNDIDRSKIDSFVFLSTSSVKLKHQTMYSRAKRAAEEILLAYSEKYNMPITIIRPFSVTGVGEQKTHLIPVLIDSLSKGRTITLDPDPVHDFIDVQDLVDGIINLSDNKARGVFELGTGNSYTNQQVFDLVADLLLDSTEKPPKVSLVRGLRPYDSKSWVSSNFRSRSWGWQPRKSLRESIVEMIDAYVE